MRSQQASDARAALMQRSAAIRKIEQDLITLAELSQEVAELVYHQEYAVVEIAKGADETHEDLQKANMHLDKGIRSLRNARKWKWWALGICSECFSCLFAEVSTNLLSVLIVIIIVAVVVAWCEINHTCGAK